MQNVGQTIDSAEGTDGEGSREAAKVILFGLCITGLLGSLVAIYRKNSHTEKELSIASNLRIALERKLIDLENELKELKEDKLPNTRQELEAAQAENLRLKETITELSTHAESSVAEENTLKKTIAQLNLVNTELICDIEDLKTKAKSRYDSMIRPLSTMIMDLERQNAQLAEEDAKLKADAAQRPGEFSLFTGTRIGGLS